MDVMNAYIINTMAIISYHNNIPDAHNSHTSWHPNYVEMLKQMKGISKDNLTHREQADWTHLY